MTKRATRDNSSSVGLFPFLAVLLCTMGALLVLLVVLACVSAAPASAQGYSPGDSFRDCPTCPAPAITTRRVGSELTPIEFR